MPSYTPDALERGILERWDQEGTFAKSLGRRARAPRYSFYDGPPYATGAPHYGHILQSALKDTVTRHWTQRGFLVDRRVGWDCHGLPVEHMIEKELGIRTKKDIEALGSTLDADSGGGTLDADSGGGTGSPQGGVEQFNAKCRAAVQRHVGDFTSLLRRFGRWADYDHAYLTMDATYIESAWWVFKAAWERGMVYQGIRSSPYCPRCETPLSNFETTLGYKDVTDPAVTLKVKLADEASAYLLVWTTTPWTLPGNVAVAVHPDLRYVRARVGGESWIIAKERLAEVIREDFRLEDEFAGSVLVGKEYEPLYTFLEPDKPAYRVVAGTFVSATDGTGIVHIAPAFGEEDFQLAQENDLPLLRTVDEQGRFVAAVTPWAGQFVKDADPAIIKDLEERGFLFWKEEIRHAYPHCWRCETPLLYLATDSWFVAVTKMKEQLVENAKQIRWVPGHLQEGRFGQGLRDAPDWAISRTRYWGIPLPVWRCGACGKDTVVGSLQDLATAGGDRSLLKSPHADPDLHRPYVDRVVLKCQHCGAEAQRVPEVLDVWFDSGSMPYGQWHYPFENKEFVEQTFPADFIAEALEMTRGWFYTLHVLAGVLTLPDQPDLGLGQGKAAFKNVVASGLILAEDGQKMSKSLGNYPDPGDIMSKYGADTLRLYLLSTTAIGEDMRFSDALVGDLYRRCTLILWNVWEYFRTYGTAISNIQSPISKAGPNGPERNVLDIRNLKLDISLLDRWILARTAQLAADVQAAMDAYHVDDAARALLPFVDNLSTWYVRRSRGREEALPVLHEVLRQFSVIAAPFIPFLSEHIHRELTGGSPHLEDFPTSDVGQRPSSDVGVLEQMRVIRDLAAAGHRARAEAKIKVRQPLAEVLLVGEFPQVTAAGEEGLALLRAELNVKQVSVRPTFQVETGEPVRWTWVEVGGGRLGLNPELTADLKAEGMVRDLIRAVQDLRKKAGYQFDDTILVRVVTNAAAVRSALEQHRALFLKETKSQEILWEAGATDASGGVALAGATVTLGVVKK